MIIKVNIFNDFLYNIGSIKNMTLIKCSDICLRSKWCLQDIEAAGFISSNLHKNGLLGDVMQVYSSYYLMDQVLLTTHIHFYNSASYIFQEENGDYQKIKVHIGDVVEIGLVEDESVLQALEQFSNTTEMTNKIMFLYMWLGLKMF